MSGEMLVISFVRKVNHVIMAATLDSSKKCQHADTTSNFCELTAHPRVLWHRFTFPAGNRLYSTLALGE